MLRFRMTEADLALLEEVAKAKSLDTSTWTRSELVAMSWRILGLKNGK